VFREEYGERAGRFDTAGAVVGGAAIFGLLIAVNRGATWGWSAPATVACLGLFAVGAVVFAVVERRADQPVYPIALMRDRAIRWAVVSRGAVQAAYMGSFNVLPVLHIEVGHWAPATVALALSPRPLAMGISGPVAGGLVARTNPVRLCIIGSAAVLAGVVTLVGVHPDGAYVVLLAALVAKGVGLGVAGTAASAIITARTPEPELGAISGFLSIVTSVANALGMAVLLSVVAIAGGETGAASFQWAFAAGAVLAAVGLAAALALRRGA
jgi:MFS family permease